MESNPQQNGSSSQREQLTLGQLGRVIVDHWILVVAGTVLGAIAGLVLAQIVPSVYSASTTQIVKAVPGTAASANYDAAQYAQIRARAYPSFIYSLTVLDGVRADLGGQQTAPELRDDLSAVNPDNTPLVQITALGATPQEARDKANSAARQMARFIGQVETVNGRAPVSIETVVEAGSPRQAISPRPALYAALGAVAGFAVALLAALVRAYAAGPRPSSRRRASAQVGARSEPGAGSGRRPNARPTARTGGTGRPD